MNNPQDFEAFVERAFAQPAQAGAPDRHPTAALLMDYVYEQLEAAAAARLSAHIAACGRCQDEVVQLRAELAVVEAPLAATLYQAPQIDVALAAAQPDSQSTWRQKVTDWWGGKHLSSRRAFVGHALAYGGAFAVLLSLRIGLSPSVLQGAGEGSSWLWLVNVGLLGLGVYLVVLVVHGVKVFGKRHDESD